MREIFLLGIFCCSIVMVSADTIHPHRTNIRSMERALEQRKKRLDSSLRQTDAFMDSITNSRKPDKSDTLRMLYALEARKEREEEEKLLFWAKIGVGSLLVGLAIGFYVFRKRKK